MTMDLINYNHMMVDSIILSPKLWRERGLSMDLFAWGKEWQAGSQNQRHKE